MRLFLGVIVINIKNYTVRGWKWQALRVEKIYMSIFRVILAIIFPPLAVIGDGCGSILIVFLLTLCGWIPGVIAALIISNKK